MVLSQLAASPGSGVARLIFLGHMVSTNIQGLSLSEKLHLRQYNMFPVSELDLYLGSGKLCQEFETQEENEDAQELFKFKGDC